MTCHSNPSTKCGFALARSSGPIFTTLQPMEIAELIARVWFSCMAYVESGFMLMTLVSMVSSTVALISLLNEKKVPWKRNVYLILEEKEEENISSWIERFKLKE